MVTLSDIQAAARAIGPSIERTPVRHSRTLSEIAGAEIFLKFENLQFTASFKERGALNKLLSLTNVQRRAGVVAASAGNHAQGVAYHAARLGIAAVIVMPEGTPFTKIKHTRDFGAEVLITGETLSESMRYAKSLAAEKGFAFVHPYDDPAVIAGQGTVALEFLEQAPDIDTLVVPVGGGGLISGIATAAKELRPGIHVYGVEAAAYPSMHNAVTGAVLPFAPQTIAEGIAVKTPGSLTTPIIRALVSRILLVNEADLEAAIAMMLEIEKTLIEGAAAATLAAVVANKHLFAGHKLGLVLSGGNLDLRMLSNVILRELARERRILMLTIPIEDRPGTLARIATLIAGVGGNILEVSHNRILTGASAKAADLGVMIEARDAAHATEIEDRLCAAGYAARHLPV